VIDRRGILVPLALGLGMTAVLLALVPMPQSVLLLAVFTVVTSGGPVTALATPAVLLMTDAVEHVGAALVFASMLLNLAWALGETIGAPTAAVISRATSDAVPLLLLAAAVLLTLVPVLMLRSLRPDARPVTARST
jgi:predicted MFS family arabinose efflux permease